MDLFWRGFGLNERPSFAGEVVLEIGSGKGARALEVASCGAERVIGIDPSHEECETARQQHRDSEYFHRVEFWAGYLEDYPSQQFGVVVSENTFEHVMDVPELLAEVSRRLRPGGRAYIGFGPLYHAPDGDHGWVKRNAPGMALDHLAMGASHVPILCIQEAEHVLRASTAGAS